MEVHKLCLRELDPLWMQLHHTMLWSMRESHSASSEESLVSNFFGMRIIEEESNPAVVECDTTSVLEEIESASSDNAEHGKETEEPHFPNDRFRDVAENGAWGKVSSKEILFVLIIALFLTAATVVASVYLLTRMKSHVTVLPPTEQTVEYDEMYHNRPDLYDALVGQIQQTSRSLTILEQFPTNYEGLEATLSSQNEDSSSDPYLKAAAWLVYTDLSPEKFASTILVRFTMAATFFSMGGVHWINSTNWMSNKNVCHWHGVECDNFEVQGLVLDRNNLTGTLHEAWESLEKCRSVLLRGNKIAGTLPGESLGAMPMLHILELQNNLFSGTVPSSLANLGMYSRRTYIIITHIYFRLLQIRCSCTETRCSLVAGRLLSVRRSRTALCSESLA